jgi:uncharacterized protein (TIGR03435 family)
MLVVAHAHAAQEPAREPTPRQFVTASITPSMAGKSGERALRLLPGGVFSATSVTVRELVEYAYQRHAFDHREVKGGPAWIDVERFDITARAGGAHTVDADASFREAWSMIRGLLANQFRLKVHEADSSRAVYALVLARSDGTLGPKLRRTDADCGAVMKGPMPALLPGQTPPCTLKVPPGRLFVNTVGMPTLASLLSQHVDRPVLDRTGLTGRFDVQLESSDIKAARDYKPGPSDAGLAPVTGPTIFVALPEQLGLRLQPQTAAVPVVVIDHVERPVLQ